MRLDYDSLGTPGCDLLGKIYGSENLYWYRYYGTAVTALLEKP